MTEYEFWQHMQQAGQMSYGWWYTFAALPAFIIAVSVVFLMAFAVRRVHKFSSKFIGLILALVPTLLTLPAFYAVLDLEAALAQVGITLPETLQGLSYDTTLSLGATLNTLALWGLIGGSLAVPITLGGGLIGDVPIVTPMAKTISKTITNIATRAFGNRPGFERRVGGQHGTITINTGTKKGVVESVRDDTEIGSRGDIQITDTGVSRKHAKFQIKDGAVYLVDLGSTNGTFIKRGGQMIPLNHQPVQIISGDYLYLGDPAMPHAVELIYQRQEA